MGLDKPPWQQIIPVPDGVRPYIRPPILRYGKTIMTDPRGNPILVRDASASPSTSRDHGRKRHQPVIQDEGKKRRVTGDPNNTV